MGWFHAAYAEGKIGADGGFEEEGQTCAYTPKKKVQVPPCPETLTGVEVIYHMCQKSLWQKAVQDEAAYFPPSFHKDGKFTRASVHKEGLIDTANQFYKDTEGEWICLEINLKLLLNMGIVVLPQEEAGSETKEGESSDDVQCLQVYSGITTIVPGLIKKIYPMKRGGCGTFLSLGKPVGFKKQSNVEKEVEKVTKGLSEIPGIGKVPAPAKQEQAVEQPKTKSKSKGKGIGKMFGLK